MNSIDTASLPEGHDELISTPPIPPIGREAECQLINREISWLAFNERVLAEAENSRHPLLERLRFVAISANNLDEFMMVRVAGVKHQVARGLHDSEASPAHPADVLNSINNRVAALMARQQTVLPKLLDALSGAGVSLVGQDDLNAEETAFVEEYFEREILPVIAPMTIDPAHPFPFIANRGFGVYLVLKNPKGSESNAVILLSSNMKRFINLPGEGNRVIALEDCVILNMNSIFPDHELVEHFAFRVLRDSELEVDEEAEDLVATFETALKARRRGNVIALQISSSRSDKAIRGLCEAMDVEEEGVALIGGMIGLSDLSQLCSLGDESLRFPSYKARFPERIRDFGGDCFAAISSKDILVHHPYESFDVVLQFLRQAAEDPKVVSIRQTLYRTMPDSPIVRALISAAESGKSVTAMVEIKARFDEELNIRLARDLERAGVQVVYGFVDLKTHAKLSLVVRQEETGLKSYAHCGTGNYHPITAKIYTDLSFFTSDQDICSDIVRIFNYMTSYVEPKNLNKVGYAPVTARSILTDGIDHEISAARAGKPCGIWIKLNSLVDQPIIEKLYEASQAGVPIHIVVRGICCLRPGVEGLSENIRVTSLIGRFLEHARIYIFANGKTLPSANARVYISSADLMPRNLNRRVEIMLPIENPTVHRQIIDQVMMANIDDIANSWQLQPDGSYVRLARADDEDAFSAHHFFMTNPSLSGRGSALTKDVKPGRKA
ncbi:MAG: RNA degradosome polyphosphate kinase [SAR116 cluster bacterium MED-G04]|nr:MAG: RNA degradosome polyphosphate kinase [SAR116 cluster bacterium MED-G04]CAI8414019.1 MAG: Polyphosphate kinase [SAR116 cluster bacterium MED-G04]